MVPVSCRHHNSKRLLYALVIIVVIIVTVWITDQGSLICAENCTDFESIDSKDGIELACKYPKLDPFSPVAMKYYEKFPTTSCPDGLPTVTYYDGDFVRVDQTRKQRLLGNTQIQCWSRGLEYMRGIDYTTSEWKGPSDDFISFENEKPEFVEVKCLDKKGNVVSNMHHYAKRDEIRKKETPVKHNFEDEQMNVMLIGMDSISGHLFQRAMPKTRKVLLETIGATEMNIYNKVGENTFPNLLAITTGCFEKDLQGWNQAHGFDSVPFIWNIFKKAGFRTQYMSDWPDFDDFSKTPTDSYTVPMVKALMKGKIDFDNNCFEDQIEVNLWLNLTKEFALDSLHTTGRFFSLSMMKRPTHDFPNQASAVDEHYANFLLDLLENDILNNTFLVFFGDHGQKKGSYRLTYEGSLEERGANMIINVPTWFKLKYKTLYQNLMTNANRLTTNFDIHRTMELVLNLNFDGTKPESSEEVSKVNRGLNLFSVIPSERTCNDASISAQFCMCNGGVPLSVRYEYMQNRIGNQIVNEINALTSKRPDKCAPLKLDKVTSLLLFTGQLTGTLLIELCLPLSLEEARSRLQLTIQ